MPSCYWSVHIYRLEWFQPRQLEAKVPCHHRWFVSYVKFKPLVLAIIWLVSICISSPNLIWIDYDETGGRCNIDWGELDSTNGISYSEATLDLFESSLQNKINRSDLTKNCKDTWADIRQMNACKSNFNTISKADFKPLKRISRQSVTWILLVWISRSTILLIQAKWYVVGLNCRLNFESTQFLFF